MAHDIRATGRCSFWAFVHLLVCVAAGSATLVPVRTEAAKPAAGGANAAIVDAVKRQDKTGARALIKQRADVNAVDAEGMTALHWARTGISRYGQTCSSAPARAGRQPTG